MPNQFTYKKRASPATIARNAYAAAVAGLRSAAQPSGVTVPGGLSPREKREHAKREWEKREWFERYGTHGDPQAPVREPGMMDYLPNAQNPQEVLSATLGLGLGPGLVSTIGKGAALGRGTGTLRTFLTPEPNDPALQAAREMLEQGASPNDVWTATGVGKHFDEATSSPAGPSQMVPEAQRWVREISDEGLQIRPELQRYLDELQEWADHNKVFPAETAKDKAARALEKSDLIQRRPDPFRWKPDRGVSGHGLFGRAEDMVEHPELFELLPEMKDVEVGFGFPQPLSLERGQVFGSADLSNNRLLLMKRMFDEQTGDFGYRQPLAHELQHFAQRKQGRPSGAASTAFKNQYNRDDVYNELVRSKRTWEKRKPEMRDLLSMDPDEAWELIKDEPTIGDLRPETVMRAMHGKPRSAYSQYRASPGELEAFGTQERLYMTPAQRRQRALWTMESFREYNAPETFNKPVESFLRGR